MAYRAELDAALALAEEAAAAVMTLYAGEIEAEYKADGSIVTRADKAAEAIILEGLRARFPDDPILSEETPFGDEAPASRRLWVVDPVDGTRNLYNRTGDFGVVIALVVEGRPVVGVMVAPALERAWFGGEGLGVFERRGEVVTELKGFVEPHQPLRALVSRYEGPLLSDALEALGAPPITRGSVGVKVGLLLSGEADAYLYPGDQTSLWDVCAPQALMAPLGGRITDYWGTPFTYDPRRPANPRGILAAPARIHEQIRQVIQSL